MNAGVEFFNKITAPPGLFILPSGVGVVECTEDERERFKTYIEYEKYYEKHDELPEHFRLLRRWDQGNLGIWRQTDSYLVVAPLP